MKRIGFFFAAGFLLGTILIALADSATLLNMGILSKDWLRQLYYLEVDGNALFFYCLKKRLSTALFLIAFACTNLAVPVAVFYFGILGVSAGVILSAAALQFGAGGVLFFLALLFPHGIFYGIALFFYLQWIRGMQELRMGNYRNGKNIFFVKMTQVFVILTIILLGILMESYVNPLLFNKIVKFFV